MTATTPALGTDTDFLTTLDAIVRADGALPGFAGNLAFGTLEAGIARWWRVAVTPNGASAEFLTTPPMDCDVMVGLKGTATLAAALGATVETLLSGDRALLKRFVARYLKPQSSLSVRFGACGLS